MSAIPLLLLQHDAEPPVEDATALADASARLAHDDKSPHDADLD